MKPKKAIQVVLHQSEDDRKAENAAYMRNRRKGWTEEERMKNAEQSKIRMRRYRAKKKLEKKKTSDEQNHMITRLEEKQEEERKLKETEYRKKYRAGLSAQKKRRIREKDAARKREKRIQKLQQKQMKENQESLSTVSASPLEMSDAAVKKAVYRARQKLPKTPERYAKIVKGLITNVTPNRKAALESEQIGTPSAKRKLDEMLEVVKEAHSELQGRSDKVKQQKREFVRHFAKKLNGNSKLQNLLCTATGIKRKYLTEGCWWNGKKKRRKDALPEETERKVQEFYCSEANSIIIPDKKAVKRDLQEKQVMQLSLNASWSKWNSENPNNKMSLDKFRKLRPKNVLTQKHRKLYQCLCEYCENVKLKIKSVNLLAEKVNRQDLKIENEYTAVNETLCAKADGDKFHKLKCIDRQCNICGTKVLKEKLKPLMDINEHVVTWNEWVVMKTVNPKTGKETSKRLEVETSGTPVKLINGLLNELDFLSVHLFEAQWQQQQFALLNKSLPERSVSLTIDFAQNYTCFAQNEIQAAHWSKDAVTIHPCIALYRCPKDNELVDECIDIISDDLLHDSHAVHTFMTRIINHLKENRQVEFEKAFVISDGCGAQYKSKIPLMDVSCSQDDHEITIERSYYGSRHGKNRCDGEAGVLKSKATRLVKNKKTIIQNARKFYESVKVLEKKPEDENCMHKCRTLLFVGRNEICHNRPHRDSKTVPGTRKLHSAIGINRGKIWTRRLSCFCTECLQNRYDQCLMSEYVDKWKEIVMKQIIPVQEPQPVVQEPQPVLPQLSGDQGLQVQQQPAVLDDEEHPLQPSEDEDLLKMLDIDASLSSPDISFTSILDGSISVEHPYKKGDFIVVNIQVGKHFKEYIAEIKDFVNSNEVCLQYMEKYGDALYRWPVRPEFSTEEIHSIQRKLPNPTLVEQKSNSRIQIYSFGN